MAVSSGVNLESRELHEHAGKTMSADGAGGTGQTAPASIPTRRMRGDCLSVMKKSKLQSALSIRSPKPPNEITTLKRLYSMEDLGLVDGSRARAILAIG